MFYSFTQDNITNVVKGWNTAMHLRDGRLPPPHREGADHPALCPH